MNKVDNFDWHEEFQETLVVASKPEHYESLKDEASRTHHWRNVRSSIKELIFSFDSDMECYASIELELFEKEQVAQKLLKKLSQSGLNEKIQQHLTNQVTLQLLEVARAMRSLENFSSVDDIPHIMLSMKDNMPPAILPNMKIHSFIHNTVKKTKNVLLKKFLESFEQHLDDETYGSGMESQSWASFLKQARTWLLAFTLV
eukprot:gene45536-55732_t